MLPSIFTQNFLPKLASVAVAFVLWFFVVGEAEVVTVEAVPLAYGNLTSGLVLVSDPPDSIRVELRGASRAIARENLTRLKVLLDFSSIPEPGERTFPISQQQLNLPAGVTFLRAVPSEVSLTFDRVASREVPVGVRLMGKPADGYHVARQQVVPDKVRISGPASQLAAISTALADVDIGARSESFEVTATAGAPGVKVESPLAVRVHIEIEKGNRLRE